MTPLDTGPVAAIATSQRARLVAELLLNVDGASLSQLSFAWRNHSPYLAIESSHKRKKFVSGELKQLVRAGFLGSASQAAVDPVVVGDKPLFCFSQGESVPDFVELERLHVARIPENARRLVQKIYWANSNTASLLDENPLLPDAVLTVPNRDPAPPKSLSVEEQLFEVVEQRPSAIINTTKMYFEGLRELGASIAIEGGGAHQIPAQGTLYGRPYLVYEKDGESCAAIYGASGRRAHLVLIHRWVTERHPKYELW